MDNSEPVPGRSTPTLDYHFDLNLMPEELLRICDGPNALRDEDWRAVTKVLGQFCKDNKPANLFMTAYVNTVTINFVNRFQKFMDLHRGRVLNMGNGTLQKKVYGWVENNSRGKRDTERPVRKRRIDEKLLALKNPAPPVEDYESISNKKEQLIDNFKSGSAFDPHLVGNLMAETYALQRSELNVLAQDQMVPHLLANWPYIFHPLGATMHLVIGSEINPNEAVNLFLETEYQKLIYFLIHKGGAKVAQIYHLAMSQPQEDDPRSSKLITALNMLTVYFKEDIKSLIIMVSPDLEIPDLGGTMANMPTTPCLVGIGTDPYQSLFCALINGQKVMGPAPFIQAAKVLFPLHFVLGIEYCEKVKKTCQFYERCVLDYIPLYDVVSEVQKTIIRFNEFKTVMVASSDLAL